MDIWGGLAPLQKLPKWSPQTQVVLGVLGRPGTLSDPLSVLCQWICKSHLLALCTVLLAKPHLCGPRSSTSFFPQPLFLCLPWHLGKEEGLWEPRGAQLRCGLVPGDTDSAVGGPQLDRSGEQHGGRGARAGLCSHPQRGEDREMELGIVGPGRCLSPSFPTKQHPCGLESQLLWQQ